MSEKIWFCYRIWRSYIGNRVFYLRCETCQIEKVFWIKRSNV